jgi:FHA domain/Domain of unknown function (DUF1707)
VPSAGSYIRPVTVCDHPTTRASDGDRDAALAALHGAFVQGRLSHGTLVQRIDEALRARTHKDLSLLLADLGEPGPRPPGRWLLGLVRKTSRLLHGVRMAWRAPMLPPISLPTGVADRVIGRSEDCDLVVRDRSVSREHAALRRGSDGWYIADLGSTNGTFVNGWRVTTPAPVAFGDVVTVGAASFQVVTPVRAAADPLTALTGRVPGGGPNAVAGR